MWRRVSIFFVLYLIFNFASTAENLLQNSTGIFIVTDKPYYCSGEIIRFKAFLNEAMLSTANGVLHVDLWNPDGKFIDKYNLKLLDNTANGEISLPPSLATGNYVIRVYAKRSADSNDEMLHTPVLIVNANDYSIDNIEKHLINNSGADPNSRERTFSDLPGGIEVISGMASMNTRQNVPIQISIANPGNDANYQVTVFARYRKFFPGPIDVIERVREYRNTAIGSGVIPSENEPMQQQGMNIEGLYTEVSENDTYRTIAYSILGEDPKFGFEYTNKEGYFTIDISDTKHNDKLYISTLEHSNQGLEIKPQIIPPFTMKERYTVSESDKMVLDSYVKNYMIRNEIVDSYGLQLAKDLGDSSSLYDTTRVYIEADNSYNLDTYNPFVDVPDMVREILPYVKLNKKSQKYSLYIYNRFNPNLGKRPLFLVNGLPTHDQDYILAMDVSNIHIVEILHSQQALAPFGWLGRDGIMAIYTRKPVRVPNIKDVIVNGIFKSSGPYQLYDGPDTKNTRIPLFQPSLYWNPEVNIQGNETVDLDIPAGDETGTLEIIVVGMDEHGNIITGNDTVTIEYQQ